MSKLIPLSQWVLWYIFILLVILNIIVWAISLGVPFSAVQPFIGTFLGSFLGFIAAILLDMRREERAKSEKNAAEKKEIERALNLVGKEITANRLLARGIREYLDGVNSISSQDFQNRRRDLLFYPLQTSSKDGLKRELLKVLNDTSMADLDLLYLEILNCNNLLGHLSQFISNSLKTGSMHQDYKMALATSPWSIQLHNLLPEIEKQCESVGKLIDQAKKSSQNG